MRAAQDKGAREQRERDARDVSWHSPERQQKDNAWAADHFIAAAAAALEKEEKDNKARERDVQENAAREREQARERRDKDVQEKERAARAAVEDAREKRERDAREEDVKEKAAEAEKKVVAKEQGKREQQEAAEEREKAARDKEKEMKEKVVGGGLRGRELCVHLTETQAAARARKGFGLTEKQARHASAEKHAREKALETAKKASFRVPEIPSYSVKSQAREQLRVQENTARFQQACLARACEAGREKEARETLLGRLACPIGRSS